MKAVSKVVGGRAGCSRVEKRAASWVQPPALLKVVAPQLLLL